MIFGRDPVSTRSRPHGAFRPLCSWRFAVLAATVVALVAVLLGPASPPASATHSDGVNGDLGGAIWVTDPTLESTRRLNVASGTWMDMSDHEAFPSRDGTEYIEVIRKVKKPNPDEGCLRDYVYVQRLQFRDSVTREVTSSFEIARDVAGPVRLSPDGQSMAMWLSAEDTSECRSETPANYRLTILSRTGEIVTRANNRIRAFDWTALNRLMLIVDRTDGTTYVGIQDQRDGFSVTAFVDLPDDVGSPRNLRTNLGTVGFEAVFEGVTNTSSFLNPFSFRNASAWRINLLDFDNPVTKFVTGNRPWPNDEPTVNVPLYSPDGSRMLVTERDRSGLQPAYGVEPLSASDDPSSVVVSGLNSSYALKVSEGPFTLPLTRFSEDERPIFQREPNGLRAQVFSAFDYMEWTPMVAPTCDGVPVTVVWGPGAFATSGDDVILGTRDADAIDGGEGNDVICGAGGNDTISGGPGDDRLYGGGGDDLISGGPGRDVVRGQNGDDWIYGGDGNDSLNGNNGNDRILGEGGHDYVSGRDGEDYVSGGPGTDTVRGGGRKDELYGNDGNDKMWGDNFGDTMYGGKGNDIMVGGNGPDFLSGESGNDSLEGNRGGDTLWGGNGSDTCNGQTGRDTAKSCETSRNIP